MSADITLAYALEVRYWMDSQSGTFVASVLNEAVFLMEELKKKKKNGSVCFIFSAIRSSWFGNHFIAWPLHWPCMVSSIYTGWYWSLFQTEKLPLHVDQQAVDQQLKIVHKISSELFG